MRSIILDPSVNRIYETDSYMKQVDTEVLDCIKNEDGIWVSLKDTIFFPEEGGQYADTGRILCKTTSPDTPAGISGSGAYTCETGVCVVNVLDGIIIHSDEGQFSRIMYKVDSEIEPGTKVTLELDWDKRYSRMQNHSGEHIISGLIHNTYGLENVGFHLSDDEPVTLNMNGVLTYEQVADLEREANEIIYANLPITASYPTDKELESISYRSKLEIEGQVRLITIGDETRTVDICACCAPHVHRTGEIGLLKVINVTRYKGGVQIGILCGRRAFEYVDHQQAILRKLSNSLTTHTDNVYNIVMNHIDEINLLKAELSSYKELQIQAIIENLSAEEKPCIFTDAELSPTNMKNLFNLLCERFEGYVGLFVGDGSYRYYAGSRTLDSRELASSLRAIGAKGGGSERMIQGQITASRESILELF